MDTPFELTRRALFGGIAAVAGGAMLPGSALAAATRGGRMVYGRYADSQFLDPVLNDANVDIWVMTNLFETLLLPTADGTGVQPGLATAWEWSAGDTLLTLKLRPGVRFVDGAALEAEDVVWSLRRATKEGPWRSLLESVEKVERRVTQTWGTAPSLLRPVTEWAQTIAAGQADAHPEVRAAEQALSEAEATKQQTAQRQTVERDRLTVQVYGVEQARQMRGTFRIPNPRADAEHAKRRAAEARDIIAELNARPVAEAAEWLTQRREQQRAEREALQARQEALTRRTVGLTRTGPDRRREGPGRSL